ncbi:hypothetical protein ACFXJJ_18065 [Streptomyces sp. NPDC059233]
MGTATQMPVPTEAAGADYVGFTTVVDIVNNGFKDALAEILRRLGDPHSFGEQVRYLADRQGVPRDAVDDSRALFDAFWRTTTGVTAGINWMNAAGVPERSRSYVEQIKPMPADNPSADGHLGIRWGFSLPFGISFHT